jgi:Putative Ig domain
MADEQLRRSMFVDFMYAIVVGSALPLLNSEHLNLSDVRFWAILFLLLVVLEDYFLYETQIAPFQQPGKVSPIALFIEVAILVSWYFSALAVSSKENRSLWFVTAFGLFYSLKFTAGVTHWTGFYKGVYPGETFRRNLGRGIWESLVTNSAFWVAILTAIGAIIIRNNAAPVSWKLLLSLFIASLITSIIWWTSDRWMRVNIATRTLPQGTVNTPYGPIPLIATRITPPCRWTRVSGALPIGVNLDEKGELSGTPTVAGNSSFVLKVTDAASKTKEQQFTIVVL